MPAFRDISIRRKLLLLFMLATAVALTLAATGIFLYERTSFRTELARNAGAMAQIAGDNCTAAIRFEAAADAAQVLGAFRSEPFVRAGVVYRDNGTAFAHYRRPDLPPTWKLPPIRPPGDYFTPTHLAVYRPITLDGDTIGTVYLESGLEGLRARILRFAAILIGVLLISLAAVFWLATRLQHLISDPILSLAETMRTVSTEKNYTIRVPAQSRDEIGQLIDGFNEMLSQIQARDTALQQAQQNLEIRVDERTRELQNEMAVREKAQNDLLDMHKKLVDTSRRAGMAEVASSVLHNVGNVLNSVNVCANLIEDQVRQSKVASLGKAVALLLQHKGDLARFLDEDPKGKLLPDFFALLEKQLCNENEAILRELEPLAKNIEHIKQIVAMQQNYARVGGVLENVLLAELIDDAIQINAASCEHHGVQIQCQLEPLPPFPLDKYKVMQILVNLLRNARQSLQDCERSDKLISVRMHRPTEARAQIIVIDNGAGIEPDNLTRIFNHGFTTKEHGHGFGLHSGALAAQEMGGSLTAHSDGPGKGATFTLELPIRPLKPARPDL